MLDPDDLTSRRAINELKEIARRKERDIVLWIGAGASRWCGFPSWGSLAESLHTEFSLYEPNYDKSKAYKYLKKGEYPAFFETCKVASSTRYNKAIVGALTPKETTSIYARFIDELKKISPLYVLTTNQDVLLETHLPQLVPVLWNNIDRCTEYLNKKNPFICKLHGSISDVGSLIFSSSDYERLTNDTSYINGIESILTRATVVFLGYGLGDDYLLESLAGLNDMQTVFGNGPHFAVLPKGSDTLLPKSVRAIKYLPQSRLDHREAVRVLAEMSMPPVSTEMALIAPPEGITLPARSSILESLYFLTNVWPAGKVTTSQTINLVGRSTGEKKIYIVGHGITDAEMPIKTTTSYHDLVVGLICFEKIAIPLSSIGALRQLLGGTNYEMLISETCFRFVDYDNLDGIMFDDDDKGIANGRFLTSKVRNKDKSGDETVDERLMKQISHAPGKEAEFDEFKKSILRQTTVIQDNGPEIENLISGLLHFPSIRKVLGISEGIQFNCIPKWYVWQILRLAQVARVSLASQRLNVASVAMEFGSAGLCGPVFSSTFGIETADSAASYIVAGNFRSDLGHFLEADPEFLKHLLSFRATSEAVRVRSDIMQSLSSSLGSEFIGALNAGLISCISTSVLQSAREKLASISNLPGSTAPILWNYPSLSTRALSLWRVRAAHLFCEECKKKNIVSRDDCPCGSGDSIKDCCGNALGGAKGQNERRLA